MANQLIEYRIRIRNAANSADAVTATSIRGDANHYISAEPSGDGASFDPNTGVVTSGQFSVRVVDPITSGTDRFFSSQLEDANGRQQLGHRRAYIEQRIDGGAWTTRGAGRIGRYGLDSDIEWDIAVSDFLKAEHEFRVFDPAPAELITDFLNRWPNRGCIAGGIIGGFAAVGIVDMGGWIMRVRTDAGTNRYRLEPVRIWDGANREVDLLESGLGALINKISWELPHAVWELGLGTFETIRDTMAERVAFPGLITLIDGVPWRPLPARGGQVNYEDEQLNHNAVYDLVSAKPGQTGLFVHRDQQGALTNGALVHVRVLMARPHERSPIYFSGHPIDFVTSLAGDADIPYDSASVETVRDTIGALARFSGRFTEPASLGELAEGACYGPLGVAARQGDDGELEYFCTRRFPITLPAVTIDEDDVVEGTTRAFDLDTSQAIRHYALEHTKLSRAISQSLDGVAVQVERFERTNDDPGAIGTGNVVYNVPGQLHLGNTKEMQLTNWTNGQAFEMFGRYGRGPVRAFTTLLPTGAGANVKLGDEILVDLPQIPNANKRLLDAAVSARAMQIVHLTRKSAGIEVELIDSGPNASPHATVPTHTIAASSDRPRNVGTITITNAATLNGQSAGLRLQMALDTGGGAPAAEDYSDVAFFMPGAIPTGVYRLPVVTADATVYVRARAEKNAARPSSWSTPSSVNLTGITAPSAVTGTPAGDGTRAEITWTNGVATLRVEVWLSLASEVFADATLIADLPAGSDRYSMYDLTPSTNYTVYVRHRDEETDDVSATAEDDFTSGATPATLTAPTNPDGFSFFQTVPGSTFGVSSKILQRNNRYGIVVKATEFPSFIEVQEAVETAAGAGTYGSFATVATQIKSESGSWTLWSDRAPNDGLRRKLKARHVREGATASSYTAEVIVTPGTNDPIPQFPLDNVGPDLDVVAVPSSTNYTINYTVDASTFEYSTDGAAYTSVPASGFTVSRNAVGGAAKTLTFRAVKDGQTVSSEIEVPAQRLGTISLTLNNPLFDSGANTLDVTWSSSGMPSGTTFNVSYKQDGGDGTSGFSDGATSTHQFTGVTGATGSGISKVDAIYDGAIIASKTRAGTWAI